MPACGVVTNKQNVKILKDTVSITTFRMYGI